VLAGGDLTGDGIADASSATSVAPSPSAGGRTFRLAPGSRQASTASTSAN